MIVRKAERGYSLTMWVILFAMLVTSLAFFFTPLRRALRDKVIGTSNYVIWDQFGTRGLSNIRDQVKDIDSSENLQSAETTFSGTLSSDKCKDNKGNTIPNCMTSDTRTESKQSIATSTESSSTTTSGSTSWR